jgi:ribosome-associated heat shock protein Hsp15
MIARRVNETLRPPERVRLDKWLWAARFFKSRALACEAIDKGRVSVNGVVAKRSRELHAGDEISLRYSAVARTVILKGLSERRGPASAAQALYEETPESLARRARSEEQRRQRIEPALAIEHGRPTKRDRRQLAQWRRWTAHADEADDPPSR